MFPNKILQKVSKAEILQNARVGTAVHCLPEWQAPVWVLTGFACYSARKSRSYHAGFRKCSYTCCACYSPFPMLASAISLIGNRRQPPPCLPKSETDGSQWRRSSAFFWGWRSSPDPTGGRCVSLIFLPPPVHFRCAKSLTSLMSIIPNPYFPYGSGAPIISCCLKKLSFLHQVRRQYLWQIVQS